ncbi:S-layer homology domain-containing protein [Vallitalea maricola]|uniref:Uncharacterized protein n=1 Tax=Vallitalea maricola TaxID=3074433 RepID=A0ACB5UH25_9FIRM|nr:hypothetical protein AN2V17_14780 [Vallitalea sp. AN17-2]
MKKVLKRVMATVLCILTLSQGIYANELVAVKEKEADSSILKVDEVTEIVKKELKIGKEFELEDSRLSTDDYYLKKVWNLVFKSDDKNIQVRVDAETGKIIEFEHWGRNDGEVLKYTKEQVRKTAEKYIDDNYADIKKELVEIEEDKFNRYISYYGRDNYVFIYARKLSNEIFKENYISISVSGITGEITGFKIVWDDSKYTKKNSEISEKEARLIFEKEDGLKLKYIKVNKEEDKNTILTLKPVYYYEIINSGLLDSVTKKFYDVEDIYSYNRDEIVYNDAATNEKEAGGLDRGQEMIPEKGAISREKAQKTIVEKISKITDTKNLNIKRSNYQGWYNGIDGKFWNMTLENDEDNIYVNVTLDADSGKILEINYNKYSYRNNDSINRLKLELASGELTKEDFETKAKLMLAAGEITKEQYDNRSKDIEKNAKIDTDALNKKAQNIMSNMFPNIDKKDYSIDIEPSQDENVKAYVKGTRVINDIEYNRNGFSMEFDVETNEVVRFSFEWFYNIEVEEPKTIIAKEKVSEIFYDQVGFDKELIQLKDKDKEEKENVLLPLTDLALVYKLKPYRFSYIDVENGKLLDYSGEEYKDNDEAEYFTDIKGNKYEQSIKLMNKMGFIRETNDKFSPNATLTKKDAIKWIVLTLSRQYEYIPSAKRNYYGNDEISFKDIDEDDEYYRYVVDAVRMNIIEDGKYFNKNHKVTLMEMTKWIINGMGQKDLAEYTDIFAKEQGVADNDQGYIGLAKYYKLIEDTTNIKKTKSRAETIDILYDFIANLEESSK